MMKPIYDEKYLEDEVKELKTIDDAFCIVMAYTVCGNCRKCPVRMYESPKGHGCDSLRARATEMLEAKFDIDGNDDEEVMLAFFKFMVVTDDGESTETKSSEPCNRTCSTCLYSQMHPSGILYCKSFGNFVHEDGFCYRFESDKMENGGAEIACG